MSASNEIVTDSGQTPNLIDRVTATGVVTIMQFERPILSEKCSRACIVGKGWRTNLESALHQGIR